ncbi:MAG: pyridoxamine 5'-phosphate oxidase family protein [Actinomycetota bacterium]|nr:pyridoxamine 5'-phosphate oxidase family protein [Actinomycetota bacterium]
MAQRLLASTEYARIAYIARDGTPRLNPMLFHWNGTEIVLPSFATAAKLRAIRANPAVAITIDSAGPPAPGAAVARHRRGTGRARVRRGIRPGAQALLRRGTGCT